jgi:hypothetical protein
MNRFCTWADRLRGSSGAPSSDTGSTAHQCSAAPVSTCKPLFRQRPTGKKSPAGIVAQESRRLTDSADPVGDFFYQTHKALLDTTIRHLRKCFNEAKRMGGVEECEHLISVSRSTALFIEKHRDGYIENFCKLLQATGSDPADALFVLLHLLVGYSQRAGKSLLG